MNLTKIYLSILPSIFISTPVFAGSYYDDWDVQQVPIIKETTVYYGNTICVTNLHIGRGIIDYNQRINVHISREMATTERKPTVIHYAPHIDENNNYTPYYPYQCRVIYSLEDSFVREDIIGWKNKYTPIAPFPTHSLYEFGSCRYYVRQGTIEVGVPASSSNIMKVYISNGKDDYPNNLIYSGTPKSFVGLDISTRYNTQRKFRVKMDSGSSQYGTASIPACSGGSGDREEF